MSKLRYCDKRIYSNPKEGREHNKEVTRKLRYYFCRICIGYHATKQELYPGALKKYKRLNYFDPSKEKLAEYYADL